MISNHLVTFLGAPSFTLYTCMHNFKRKANNLFEALAALPLCMHQFLLPPAALIASHGEKPEVEETE